MTVVVKKKRKLKKRTSKLDNWPPSRGPMPARLRKKPKYVIPDLVVETVEWVVAKNGRKPATEIKRIPTKPAPALSKKSKALLKKGIHCIADHIAKDDAISEVYLNLNGQVTAMATLKPEQWDLVGGAELRKSNRRIRGSNNYADISTRLPTRTITVDLDYPLSRTARITIKPYTCDYGYSKHEYMSVGYVLWSLARAYRAVYKQHKKYGVWGHAITDLCFESFELSDNIGRVSIGS